MERSSDSCHLDFSDAQTREERVVAPEILGMLAGALQASDGGVVRGFADMATDGGVEDGAGRQAQRCAVRGERIEEGGRRGVCRLPVIPNQTGDGGDGDEEVEVVVQERVVKVPGAVHFGRDDGYVLFVGVILKQCTLGPMMNYGLAGRFKGYSLDYPWRRVSLPE